MKKLHPVTILLPAVVSMIFILVRFRPLTALALAILGIAIAVFGGLRFGKLFGICVALAPLCATILLLNLLYPSPEEKALSVPVQFLGFAVPSRALTNGIANSGKLFFLSVVSICAASVTDLHKLIMHLMQRGTISTIRGYAVFVAVNALPHAVAERQRLSLLMKMRRISPFSVFLFLFNMFVFGVKYAQRGTLALLSRGIGENKTWFFDYAQSKNELICSIGAVVAAVIVFLLSFATPF